MTNKISDNTIVRVRMPKKLYEAVKHKLKINESDSVEESVVDQPIQEGSIPPEIQQAAEQIATFLKSNWGMIGTIATLIFGAKKIASNIKDKSAVDSSTGYDR